MEQSKIGLIGLAVMGQNFALNFAHKGIRISVFNRTASKTIDFVSQHQESMLIGTKTIEEFVQSLERPRKIILLVQAGKAVDLTIESLLPHLEEGDIIIDGGNSFFQDTQRRFKELASKKIRFMGMGVSGGEKGALEGPSLMPGGDREIYKELAPLLLKVAAQDPEPCVDFIGDGGAGHFVKMVHNGIEYADMQLISEVYALARYSFAYSDEELAELFDYFQTTDLNSYLIEITAKILRVKDENKDSLLIDSIRDEAKGKGTGTWTVRESASLGAPVPAIEAALDSRNISSAKKLRECFRELFPKGKIEKIDMPREESKKLLEGVLLVGKILAYEQGFSMLLSADKEYSFGLNLSSIAKIWRNGCIIRSTMLDNMSKAFEDTKLVSLVANEYFRTRVEANIPVLRKAVSIAIETGIPTPALGTSLWYLEGLRTEQLPANLIQAQRDFFGAHTYKRTDREGNFHTQWEGN